MINHKGKLFPYWTENPNLTLNPHLTWDYEYI